MIHRKTNAERNKMLTEKELEQLIASIQKRMDKIEPKVKELEKKNARIAAKLSKIMFD